MGIVLDAMGGDHAPEQIVKGALLAAPKIHHDLILVGIPEEIVKHIPSDVPKNIIVYPATEVIGMDEKPIEAMRKKKNSSLAVGAQLVKEGRAKAMVSAGNTGAATAISLLTWRQIKGVHRPAIASIIPNKSSFFLLLDAGASPDVDPQHLVEFALMGKAYAQHVMNRPNAKVHLMNIGEEPGKGNSFAKAAHEALAKHDWFAGNIEGKDMFRDGVDVVVCDAFTGNVILKTAEGIGEFVMEMIMEQVPSSKLARLPYLPLRKILAPLKKKVDYSEYGGSPLLGLNGLCIIAHGRSNAKAIHNALLMAQRAIDHNLVDSIKASIEEEA
jgi:glycerol-3-phosphate acyltransferase PlsX